MRADWQQLLVDLDLIRQRAVEAQGHLRDTAAAAKATLEAVATTAADLAPHLDAMRSSASSAEGDVSSSMGRIMASAASAGTSVGRSASEMTTQVQQAASDVAAGVKAIADATTNVKQHVADKLDDLQQLLADHNNLWNKGVDEMIDAVRVGAVPIERLLQLYGDAIVNGQRVREFLDGLDLHKYVRQVDELATGLYAGTVKISEVTDFLGKTQLLFAKQIKDTIDLFEQGKVSFEDVERVIQGFRKLFPQTDFDSLLKALEDALRKGLL